MQGSDTAYVQNTVKNIFLHPFLDSEIGSKLFLGRLLRERRVEIHFIIIRIDLVGCQGRFVAGVGTLPARDVGSRLGVHFLQRVCFGTAKQGFVR